MMDDRIGRGTQAARPAMVAIPGGEFTMGADTGGDDSPAHRVYLDAFLLDRTEVTNSHYLAFCEATGHRLPEFWGQERYRSSPAFPDHPVVGVCWHDAAIYAEWCGVRLPTEAEWEYAARGGLAGKSYPHGDDIDPALFNCSVSTPGGTAPVGGYPPNGFGLHDMAGNVVEWVADRYGADYYRLCPFRNPQGPDGGRFRVIRGGGWHSGASCNRVHFRNALPPNWVDFNVGFRCACDLDSG